MAANDQLQLRRIQPDILKADGGVMRLPGSGGWRKLAKLQYYRLLFVQYPVMASQPAKRIRLACGGQAVPAALPATGYQPEERRGCQKCGFVTGRGSAYLA